jgi:hypothetical protein
MFYGDGISYLIKKARKMETLKQQEKREMWKLLENPDLSNWSRVVLSEYMLSLYNINIREVRTP